MIYGVECSRRLHLVSIIMSETIHLCLFSSCTAVIFHFSLSVCHLFPEVYCSVFLPFILTISNCGLHISPHTAAHNPLNATTKSMRTIRELRSKHMNIFEISLNAYFYAFSYIFLWLTIHVHQRHLFGSFHNLFASLWETSPPYLYQLRQVALQSPSATTSFTIFFLCLTANQIWRP